MSQLRYWIWFTTLPGLTLRGQIRLLDHFGSPEEIFLADAIALRQVDFLTNREREALTLRDFRLADSVLENCRKCQISVMTIQDAAYPQRLRSIETPPLVLYYRGSLLPFDQLPAITVVGSRKASSYGLKTARKMGYELGQSGAAVISGAARGIDSQALEGALRAGAPVAAVLGNGLDIVYPSEAARLYDAIAARGCLISEYIPGTRPLGENFPRRNRIMSGLSMAVVVVEAAVRSGSLITAELALEQGRDVYAVPGNVGQVCSEGSNQLLQDGAMLATCGWDVLENYQARFPDRIFHRGGSGMVPTLPYRRVSASRSAVDMTAEKEPEGQEETGEDVSKAEKRIDNAPKRNYIDLQQVKDSLTADELLLAELLKSGGMHVDEVIAESGIPASRVLAALTLLEVKEYVIRENGNIFASNLQ